MRNVYFDHQRWFFSKKGNFQGLRTGTDACAEHEMGVNYPALKDGACRENPASQVDQGKR